ncbi:MAG: hypothetical protein J0L70_26505 [Leptolyngbya sp. UWPOB_LEPTO1]|uniref:hypothetical protein n=1 Tax=Leptolyngbya sp. UWPOB_LEPTO1 TaxID=2815653 RepID=UPI001AD5AC83|nr:hypothetical protein [Leptolyngbya sp. UWPOB_LEPTO1]MBN8564092.1 hypothetical protein [Leptolyngbya sp. UWPOB_LEPTO1]
MSDLIAHYWYIGVFAIAAIVLFTQAKTAIAAAKKTMANFRLRLLFFVSDQLEPDTIATFRRSIAKTFGELSNFLEKSELELLRSRMDNVFLKDKIQELEQNREALLQELGGSSDFLNIEFSIWQQMIQAVNLLVNDRLALLQKIELINSYDGNFEALSKDVEALQANNKAAEQRISALLDEQTTLRTENGRLSRLHEYSQTRIKLLRSAEEKVQMLERQVATLKQTESTLKQELDQSNRQITQLEHQNVELGKQNARLKQQNDQLERSRHESELTVRALENANQEYIQTIESLNKDIERVRSELAQQEAQIQQRDRTIESLNKDIERVRNELLQQESQIQQQELQLVPDELETNQENMSLQILVQDHNADRIGELEAEASYWRSQASRSKAREKAWNLPDYASYSDYLSYVQYWREHPEYY